MVCWCILKINKLFILKNRRQVLESKERHLALQAIIIQQLDPQTKIWKGG